MQDAGRHFNCRERPLSKEALKLFHGDRFHFRSHTRQRCVALSLIVHLRRPPIVLPLLTNLRSCCATYPIRRRKPESHAARRRGGRPTSARNARHALRCTLQRARPANGIAWACESTILSRPKRNRRQKRRNTLRAGARCTLC